MRPAAHHARPRAADGSGTADITYPDVKALMARCLSREADDPHGTALSRLVTVVSEGLKAP